MRAGERKNPGCLLEVLPQDESRIFHLHHHDLLCHSPGNQPASLHPHPFTRSNLHHPYSAKPNAFPNGDVNFHARTQRYPFFLLHANKYINGNDDAYKHTYPGAIGYPYPSIIHDTHHFHIPYLHICTIPQRNQHVDAHVYKNSIHYDANSGHHNNHHGNR